MKLHETKSDENYQCGICSREVKKGQLHHDHDQFINGRTWGLDALLKQKATKPQKLAFIQKREN